MTHLSINNGAVTNVTMGFDPLAQASVVNPCPHGSATNAGGTGGSGVSSGPGLGQFRFFY